jgi:hypothetical protein
VRRSNEWDSFLWNDWKPCALGVMIEEVSPGRNTVRGSCIQPTVGGAKVGSVGQDLGNGEEGRIWCRVECRKRIVVLDQWRGGSEVLI